MKLYLSTIGGIWIGVLLSIVLCRYVTIPPLPWLLMTKLGVLMGLFATPVLCFCVWCAETANRAVRRK